MPRSLDELLARLQEVVEADPVRRDAAEETRPASEALASRLPLVHRTGPPRPWRAIFDRRVLEASEVGSDGERALGYERAVYLFAGCGAYPKGNVALLFSQALARRDDATFTPFDSGGLDGHSAPEGCDPATWDADERRKFLDYHLGQGCDLADFLGPYLAAHFRDPAGYVDTDHIGEPDFPAYHGLVSTNGDRRAWTAEVQIHDDIPIAYDRSSLTVLLNSKNLLLDLPPAAQRIAQLVRGDEDDDETRFARSIADHVLTAMRSV